MTRIERGEFPDSQGVGGEIPPTIAFQLEWRAHRDGQSARNRVSAGTAVDAVVRTTPETAEVAAGIRLTVPVIIRDIDHAYPEACKAAGLELGKFKWRIGQHRRTR